jgi:hypothetical protein
MLVGEQVHATTWRKDSVEFPSWFYGKLRNLKGKDERKRREGMKAMKIK